MDTQEVRLTPVLVMVHLLRENIKEKFKLLSDLKDFDTWIPFSKLGASDTSADSCTAKADLLDSVRTFFCILE